jgi:hypothetical protein
LLSNAQRYKIPSSHASIPLYLFSPTLCYKQQNASPIVHLSSQKTTKLGQEVNPFSMDLGDVTGGQR